MIAIKKRTLLLGMVSLIVITSVVAIVIEDMYWESQYSQSLDDFNEWDEFEGETILKKLFLFIDVGL